MPRLDESRPFLAVNIAVLTVSDTRGPADDKSGRTLVELIEGAGHKVAAREIVRDDAAAIVAQLERWIADPSIDVVISTGGTGVTGRDVTPEAFESVFEKKIDGFGELFRWLSYQKVGTSTIQSRATGGSPAAPTSSRFREAPAPAATRGKASSSTSSTTGTARAISSSSCRACRST